MSNKAVYKLLLNFILDLARTLVKWEQRRSRDSSKVISTGALAFSGLFSTVSYGTSTAYYQCSLQRFRMPDTITNGYTNGHMPYDMEDGSVFLFTSESVGEGHPGK